jgi:hypothetical protein
MFHADVGPSRIAVWPSASTVVAAGITRELVGGTRPDHFASDVSTVGEEALCDQAPISLDVQDCTAKLLAGDQTTKGGRCSRSAAMRVPDLLCIGDVVHAS